MASSDCQITNMGTSADNVRWMQITTNGVTMYLTSILFRRRSQSFIVLLSTIRYGRFLDFALLDTEIRLAEFKYIQDNGLSITVPHFWDSLGIFRHEQLT